MKKTIILLLFIAAQKTSVAQNVGIGTTEPMNKLQVQGNLLVTTPTTVTNIAPTVAQTKTMVNNSTITFLNTDSTGRIYDPGGPSGNYLANMIAYASFDGFGTSIIGIEITAEAMALGTGDSLIIKETSSSTNILLAVGNGYTATGKWFFNSTRIHIIFKSNADPATGIGFSLLFKALYNNSASLPDISGATGQVLSFDTKNGSFRSGLLNNDAKGNFSTAMGQLGTASGFTSTAIGFQTTASGNYSIATGVQTTASGDFSTAMGRSTTASGDNSTAMGNNVSTNNQDGSFVIGDNSISTVMNSLNANNFRARFAGGYKLFTSANLATGCTLFAGDNAWTTGSDVRSKENFAAINGEDFLKKISQFNLTSWNYKTQDPKTFRHYGPMAQDFYAAFGKDEYGTIGNDTSINSADFAGVSFIAIQALEKRTQKMEALEKENALLKNDNTEMKAMLLQLRKEMDELKIKNITSPKIL